MDSITLILGKADGSDSVWVFLPFRDGGRVTTRKPSRISKGLRPIVDPPS